MKGFDVMTKWSFFLIMCLELGSHLGGGYKRAQSVSLGHLSASPQAWYVHLWAFSRSIAYFLISTINVPGPENLPERIDWR